MTEQEKFEAWHLAQFGVRPDRATDTTHVDYLREHHQLMWRGWQAAIESQWQPIETAPKDGTVIFGFWKSDTAELHNKYSMSRWFDSAWFDPDGISEYSTPSSWMPLPQPPKE